MSKYVRVDNRPYEYTHDDTVGPAERWRCVYCNETPLGPQPGTRCSKMECQTLALLEGVKW